VPFGTPRAKIKSNMEALSLSLEPAVFLSALIVILSVTYYILQRKRLQNNKYPPSYKGWIPWIGCAFEFGVAPLGFIDKKRREVC
jgi:24-hydroxycholesterol 7alpha-hydroxylase